METISAGQINPRVPLNTVDRLNLVIENAWSILFSSIVTNRIVINKEASLQLHLAKKISDLGTAYCILPDEIFSIEMETDYERKNIDIVCGFNDIKAAIELKCFRKASKRAIDTDIYDVLTDIARLECFNGFSVKKFYCLTDNKYYAENDHLGMAKPVSLRNNTLYIANQEIIPSWQGKWKNRSKDESIRLKNDFKCKWIKDESGWYYLKADIV